jgi:hypothetical protein
VQPTSPHYKTQDRYAGTNEVVVNENDGDFVDTDYVGVENLSRLQQHQGAQGQDRKKKETLFFTS